VSVPTNVTSVITLAQFEDNYIQGLYDEEHIVYLGANSSGTTVLVRRRIKPRTRRFQNETLLITDLTGGIGIGFAMFGSVSITIPLDTVNADTTVTLSPALEDVMLSHYNVQATVNSIQLLHVWASAYLQTTSKLVIALNRLLNAAVAANSATGVTVAGSDLSDQSGFAIDTVLDIVSGPHGSDLSGAGYGHGHNTQAHPVTDPEHAHGVLLSNNQAAITANVDWLILHA
jgi:hypothetical protein